MIPKIIHFCWLSGNPYPKKIKKCIKSWKKILPEYEIMLWDKERFDVHSVSWVKEAYVNKKYAFCADYIRFYALYNYGGIYLDSDVEVLKSFDDLLNLPYFIGYENNGYFEAATIGAEKGNGFIKMMLDSYEDNHFMKQDGSMDQEPLPYKMLHICDAHYRRIDIGSINGFVFDKDVICVFPSDWFSPIKKGKRDKLILTENTYSIHQFASSWFAPHYQFLIPLFGRESKITHFILGIFVKYFGITPYR